MRPRNTIIALIIAAIVGGYALFVLYYSKPEEAQKLLTVSPDDIAKISLDYPARKDNPEIVLERKKGGEWEITKPFNANADQTTVQNLAHAISDCEITKTVDDKPADLAPFGLKPPGAIVTVTTFAGKQLPAINVGGTTPVGFNAYVRLSDKPAVMLTSSAFPSGMNKTIDQVRDRSIVSFKIDDVTSFTIAHDNGELIEISRDKGQWRVTKPANYLADSTQVQQLLSTLNDLKAVDFVSDTPANVNQYGLGKPHLVVTVYTGTKGMQQSLLFGFKQTEQGKDGVYVRRGESTPVYTVHEYIMTSLDKHLLDLRDKTVLDFQPSDVQSASVRVESDQFSVERKTGGWNLIEGGKTEPADIPAVERLLDDIRELRGSAIIGDPVPSLAPFGLDRASIEITLTGKDGKSIGTVKLAKVANKAAPSGTLGAAPQQQVDYYAMSTASSAVYALTDYSYSQLNRPASVLKSREASPTAKPSPAK